MDIPLSRRAESRLRHLAVESGRTTEQFVADLLEQFIRYDDEIRAGVQHGITQAERGAFIDEEEMDARVASWFADS